MLQTGTGGFVFNCVVCDLPVGLPLLPRSEKAVEFRR